MTRTPKDEIAPDRTVRPSSAAVMVDLRKVIAVVVVSGVTLLLAIGYVMMINPAAAREIRAACTGLRPAPRNASFAAFPSSALEFTAKDYKNQDVKLSDFRGKVVFVNFWATWCNVCKSEKPGLEKLQQELGGPDFVVLTLASDNHWNSIRASFPDGTPLEVLLDPPDEGENLGRIAKSYGITAVPESFVIDKQGKIRHYFINKRDWSSDVAKTCIQSLIDE